MNNIKINLLVALERCAGRRFASEMYLRMCIRRLRRAGCIFIHIPKAAGTSVAQATIGRRAGHYRAAEIKAAMQPGEFESLFSFSVTRHPLDRLISAYRYARNGGGSEGGIRHNPAYLSSRFRSFDAFVHEWLVEQDLGQIDHVFRPQVPFVFEDGQCLVDYVGQFERLDEVEARLSEELERSIRVPKKNTSRGEPGQEKNEVWKETKQVVYELYREDFERFGYELGD